MAVQIDPKTGERVDSSSPTQAAPQIDPQTGERVEAAPATTSDSNTLLGGAKNIGARILHNASSIVQPLLHPADALESGLQQQGNNMRGIHNPDAIDEFKGTYAKDKPLALENAAGDLATMELTHGIAKAVPAIGTGMRSAGAAVDNAAIGASAGDMEHGANPGRALSTNRVVGTSPAGIAPKLKTLIPQATADNRAVLAAHQGNPINTGPLVSQPFSDVMAKATDPVTGAATPTQVSKAGLTQRLLTHVPDENTGKPTPLMRNPIMQPVDAAQLKSNIYGMTDYDNPSRTALSNSGLKSAAHGIKTAIETEAPESIPSGQRLHDLMAAKDIVEPKARGTLAIPTSKSGLIGHAVTGGLTAGAAGLDATGAGFQKIAPFLQHSGVLAVPPIGRRKDLDQ